MSETPEQAKPAAPEAEEKSNFIEKMISSAEDFVIRYVNTCWMLLRWPFKRSPDLLAPGSKERTLPPLSFLFVCGSIFYFAIEMLLKFRQRFEALLQRAGMGDPSPYSDVAWSSYTVDSFALYTAPSITIVIILAHVCGRFMSKAPEERAKIRSGIFYLSGYILLLLSLGAFAFTAAVLNFMRMARGTDMMLLLETLLLLAPLVLLYAGVNVLVLLYSFSKDITPRVEPPKRRPRALLLRFVVLFAVIIAGIPSAIASTVLVISKALPKEYDPAQDLSAVMVLTNDAEALSRQELMLSVALTNSSSKTLLLFPFVPIRAEFKSPELKQPWQYTFVPNPARGKFLELGPGATLLLEGALVKHDPERQAWLEGSMDMDASLTLRFVGRTDKEHPVETLEFTVARGRPQWSLFLRGFSQKKEPVEDAASAP